MSFVPTTWVDNGPPFMSAAQLNRMEAGIAAAYAAAASGGHPPLVSTLPASPADGDEIYLQTTDMAFDYALWHLRYRAGAARWFWVGGSEWEKLVTTGQSPGTLGVWTNLTTDGPKINGKLPQYSAYYRVRYGARMMATDRKISMYAAIALGDVNPASSPNLQLWTPDTGSAWVAGNNMVVVGSQQAYLTVNAAPWELKMRYNASLAGATFIDRWMAVRPVYIDQPAP